MKRKAQAALEFLMTYGWAFLVILVMIGALAYFGVLNPTKLLPERCTVTAGFQCEEFVIGVDGPTLVLQNGLGSAINVKILNFTATSSLEDADNMTIDRGTVDVVVSADDTFTIVFTGMGLGDLEGEKTRVSFEIEYVPVGKNLAKKISGEAFGLVG